ncbi:MAG: hypothetical protein ACRD30_04015, partial [Bryobacteraceae bacterium]
MKNLCFWAVCVSAAALASGQTIDTGMLAKMRAEAFDRSQAAQVFDMLTVNIGPRLTASPAHKRAVEWTRNRLASYGLENVHLEPWRFGRGWELEKLTVEMTEPRYFPLIGYADAWSPSTNGEISGAPVFLGGKTPAEVEKIAAQLKGAIVMTAPIETNFVRQDRPQPSEIGYVPNSGAYATGVGRPRGSIFARGPAQEIAKILGDAGAGVLLKPSRGEDGTVFVTGRDLGPGAAPSITLSAENYNMIARMIEQH